MSSSPENDLAVDSDVHSRTSTGASCLSNASETFVVRENLLKTSDFVKSFCKIEKKYYLNNFLLLNVSLSSILFLLLIFNCDYFKFDNY